MQLKLRHTLSFHGLKYLYSVISGIEKRLPGDTKKWTLIRSWTARVLLVHPLPQPSIPRTSGHCHAADAAYRGRNTPERWEWWHTWWSRQQAKQAGRQCLDADCPHEGCQTFTTASEALRWVGVGLERWIHTCEFGCQIPVSRRAFGSSKSYFYEENGNVPPAFKQYKIQGNASNLVQSHFGSPPWKELESGIAPLVPRGFDPACWGLNQLPPSHPWAGGRLRLWPDFDENSRELNCSSKNELFARKSN